MLFCQLCKNLAVQANIGGFEHGNEARVGKSELMNRCIDLDGPEIAEGSLLGSAVAESVRASFEHGWSGKTDLALSTPLKAFNAL